MILFSLLKVVAVLFLLFLFCVFFAQDVCKTQSFVVAFKMLAKKGRA